MVKYKMLLTIYTILVLISTALEIGGNVAVEINQQQQLNKLDVGFATEVEQTVWRNMNHFTPFYDYFFEDNTKFTKTRHLDAQNHQETPPPSPPAPSSSRKAKPTPDVPQPDRNIAPSEFVEYVPHIHPMKSNGKSRDTNKMAPKYIGYGELEARTDFLKHFYKKKSLMSRTERSSPPIDDKTALIFNSMDWKKQSDLSRSPNNEPDSKFHHLQRKRSLFVKFKNLRNKRAVSKKNLSYREFRENSITTSNPEDDLDAILTPIFPPIWPPNPHEPYLSKPMHLHLPVSPNSNALESNLLQDFEEDNADDSFGTSQNNEIVSEKNSEGINLFPNLPPKKLVRVKRSSPETDSLRIANSHAAELGYNNGLGLDQLDNYERMRRNLNKREFDEQNANAYEIRNSGYFTPLDAEELIGHRKKRSANAALWNVPFPPIGISGGPVPPPWMNFDFTFQEIYTQDLIPILISYFQIVNQQCFTFYETDLMKNFEISLVQVISRMSLRLRISRLLHVQFANQLLQCSASISNPSPFGHNTYFSMSPLAFPHFFPNIISSNEIETGEPLVRSKRFKRNAQPPFTFKVINFQDIEPGEPVSRPKRLNGNTPPDNNTDINYELRNQVSTTPPFNELLLEMLRIVSRTCINNVDPHLFGLFARAIFDTISELYKENMIENNLYFLSSLDNGKHEQLLEGLNNCPKYYFGPDAPQGPSFPPSSKLGFSESSHFQVLQK